MKSELKNSCNFCCHILGLKKKNQIKSKCQIVVKYYNLVLCPTSRALQNGIRAMVPNLEPEGSQLICWNEKKNIHK